MALRNLLFLFVVLPVSVLSQVLKGQLTDQAGEPIPFGNIQVAGSTYGTFSSATGNFQLDLKQGTYRISFTASGYLAHIDTIKIGPGVTYHNVKLDEDVKDLDEAIISVSARKDMGHEIMEKVIAKRKGFYEAMSKYKCSTYCFTSLEKESKEFAELKKRPRKSEDTSLDVNRDTSFDVDERDTVPAKRKINLTEWNSVSYFKSANRYKDFVEGFTDLTDKPEYIGGTVTIETGNEGLQPTNGEVTDPYIFVNSYQDANINLFENLISAPGLSLRPLTSPMAYNAFVYYTFSVEESFYDDKGAKIYVIKVIPRFKEEALFHGKLFIRDESWELVSYELGINKGAMTYFREMRLVCDYEKIGERLVPTRREFIYLIKEGQDLVNGNIRLRHTDYAFEYDDSHRKFWLETKTYDDRAFDRDSAYWNKIRPFHLKQEDIDYIHQQDSIIRYHNSEEYLRGKDSTFNTLNVWSFLFNGVGFRNTFKKQEFRAIPLIQQPVPFGVGGYRHQFQVSYNKTFQSGRQLSLLPHIDYGFNNKDLKGYLGVGFMYNTMRFCRLYVEAGDVYDFMNSYQSIQGTFSPANRVRNQKLEINHKMEIFNGLYFKTGIFFSDRSDIGKIDYPEWAEIFGTFSEPVPFDGYRIFMTDLEFEYHFRQKYMIKKRRKIIVGSPWPVLALQYKKGLPNVFGGQSDFDFMELRLTDDIKLNTLGMASIRCVAGGFLRKSDLRLVEHKFFRTSDKIFFSNPMFSLQLLDTSLNTSNSYLQFNYIHHFNGFFLNKVPLINKLKLQETVGGNLLVIPDAGFAQAELYVGIEKQIRIRKQIFKVGIYAVTADSSFDKSNLNFKIGVNFYDPFYNKWNY